MLNPQFPIALSTLPMSPLPSLPHPRLPATPHAPQPHPIISSRFSSNPRPSPVSPHPHVSPPSPSCSPLVSSMYYLRFSLFPRCVCVGWNLEAWHPTRRHGDARKGEMMRCDARLRWEERWKRHLPDGGGDEMDTPGKKRREVVMAMVIVRGYRRGGGKCSNTRYILE
ncbi:hypothetical protein EX30DRAFT_112434 [Ascodesmis nigricans]|uniref:Uncharacterized protein n=1 Tax=Ascodesmis nigricans TaxID=341454 RepID=A0A4S2MQ82_9PEZI|nr:hypothetical protein EX30DRAFT_112434 [Ascodesmis nigricans]